MSFLIVLVFLLQKFWRESKLTVDINFFSLVVLYNPDQWPWLLNRKLMYFVSCNFFSLKNAFYFFAVCNGSYFCAVMMTKLHAECFWIR